MTNHMQVKIPVPFHDAAHGRLNHIKHALMQLIDSGETVGT